jgi:hypothetical protein
MSNSHSKGQQPEALATLAAAARHGGKKPERLGLSATGETSALPTSPDAKSDAANRVLREGVLNRDQGAAEAVDALPDRTRSMDAGRS